ncbi:MAG: ABC transporter, partial [Clostridia bacterium]|nr:ABC transporter [Clostridia bacterium]
IEIRDLISRLGKNHTVILSSHILSEIQAVCDRIIIINGGRLVADGTPDELSKALSADGALEIRVAGPKRDVMKTLSAVPGVESVDDLGSFEKGSYDYRVVPEEKADVRKVVFARLAERNWPILSLRDSTLTLEQIFLRLTSEDAPSLEEEEENKIEEVSVKTEEESSLTMVKEENE